MFITWPLTGSIVKLLHNNINKTILRSKMQVTDFILVSGSFSMPAAHLGLRQPRLHTQ